jgi:crossover junction endodeoxyribonuclease RuvC
MRIISFDPGITGAIVVLENGQPIEWMAMPIMKIGNSTRVNAAELANFVNHLSPSHAYVELVHSMPNQGVSSCFSFGHSLGVIMGVIGALNIPYTMVTPQAWKKSAGLIGKDKDASRSRAIQLWPEWKDLYKKAKGQALADAALMGKFSHE